MSFIFIWQINILQISYIKMLEKVSDEVAFLFLVSLTFIPYIFISRFFPRFKFILSFIYLLIQMRFVVAGGRSWGYLPKDKQS
ncbi:MAG: hypothetical protein M5E90_03490 [Asgard group archaeon]|nr:hypothetical protein [Asgard group archaeon]